MNQYTLCRLVCYLAGALANPGFRWPLMDPRSDCSVGISVKDVPVGIGTLITGELVVTSANYLEPYLKKKEHNEFENQYYDPDNIIQLYVIDGQWNISKILEVNGYAADISNRHRLWVKMGFQRKHSPIHDLIFISIEKDQVKEPPVFNREAFFIAESFTSYFKKGWIYSGFGYLDNEHARNNDRLVINEYRNIDQAECDEWVPRAWGRFVCVLNVDDVAGVQSGAPLYHNGMLRGIGSFSLQKGSDAVLVFTDFKFYRSLL